MLLASRSRWRAQPSWRRRTRTNSSGGRSVLLGHGRPNSKKGADKGIDGRLYFHEGGPKDKTKQIVFSVKAGKVTVSQVRDLRGVIEREKAEIGVCISFKEPTKPMRKEAASAGFYSSPWGKHPRLQLLTVQELLTGGQINAPRTQGTNITYKVAPRAALKVAELRTLFDTYDVGNKDS